MIRPADLRRRYSLPALKNLLRRNMGLRIISLLLALGLWIFVNAGQHGSVESFNVPISYRGLPFGFVVVNPHPDYVRLQVSGPRTLLSLIDPTRLTLRLDLSGVGLGQASFKIGPDSFAAPRGTNVTSISPSQIVLDIDKMVNGQVTVRIDTVGKVADGYRVTSMQSTPATVQVRGPSKKVSLLQTIETEPIDVTGMSTDFSREVFLVTPGGTMRVKPQQVTVKIAVGPLIKNVDFRGIPIDVRNSDYDFTVTPPHVNITVRGAAPEIAKLALKGAIYLDADGMMPGVYNMPIQISLPQGIELVHESAQTARLRLLRRKRASAS
jgi:YbbR domain-containing protein